MRVVSTNQRGRTAGSPSRETLAEWTGLEPATPGVTGRYSNQLNYHSGFRATADYRANWWVLRGSNSRHSPCKGDALPTELSTRARLFVRPRCRLPAYEHAGR